MLLLNAQSFLAATLAEQRLSLLEDRFLQSFHPPRPRADLRNINLTV